MSTWLTMPKENAQARSNYPTQKCVGVLGQDIDLGFSKGAVITSFVDYDDTNYHQRKFFILEAGGTNFQELPIFEVPYTSATTTKASSVSFVVSGTKIYAVTDFIDGTGVTYAGIWLGIYDLSDGLNGDWEVKHVHNTSTVPPYDVYPDVDVNATGEHLAIVWTDTGGSNPKTWLRFYNIEQSAFQGVTFSALTYGGGDNPKASVLFEGEEYLYIHLGGDINSEDLDDSILIRGRYYENILTQNNKLVAVDIPDAQMVLTNMGHVGFLGLVSSAVVFDYYDIANQEMGGVETLDSSTATSFGYGLTFRGETAADTPSARYHALYYDTTDSLVKYKTRPFGADQSWEQGQIGDNYPEGETINYLCCQNTPMPTTLNTLFWGAVGVQTSASGSGTYPLWFRGDGQVTLVALPAGSYWTGQFTNAGTFDISTKNLSFAKRGTGFTPKEFLSIVDHVELSDRKVIFTDGVQVYAFTENEFEYDDNPISMEWQSGEFPKQSTYQKALWCRCIFEGTADFTITFSNGTMSKTVSFASTDSGKKKQIGLNFRKLKYTINQNDNSDTQIKKIQVYTEDIGVG